MSDTLRLLAQIFIILLVARTMGRLLALAGQPRVIGEMLAGILLGPSLFGWLAPDQSAALFPPGSLGLLNALSQVGLVFFMFLIGLELDLALLRRQGRAALFISNAGIALPFVLGLGLAVYLHPRLAPAATPLLPFALFLGVAMSVTAFPVLARILAEQGLIRTRVGTVTLTAAAADDVSAWCLLALVTIAARRAESVRPLGIMLLGLAAYVALMIAVVRPAMAKMIARRGGTPSSDLIAFVVLLILASAWTTEWLGVHAVFGAFLAGVVVPRDARLVAPLMEKFHDLMVILFLPLFFAFTGLRTSIALIQGSLWALCALIILVAVAGKLAGSALAARAAGMEWREALAVGTLMNTRGLMELVVLNVGLDIGVISPALFAMMVIMALVTTFMTTPLLTRIYQPALHSPGHEPAAPLSPA